MGVSLEYLADLRVLLEALVELWVLLEYLADLWALQESLARLWVKLRLEADIRPRSTIRRWAEVLRNLLSRVHELAKVEDDDHETQDVFTEPPEAEEGAGRTTRTTVARGRPRPWCIRSRPSL